MIFLKKQQNKHKKVLTVYVCMYYCRFQTVKDLWFCVCHIPHLFNYSPVP